MKKLAIVVMALLAVATLPAHAAFNEKVCMKKCTKGLTEKAENKSKDDKGEKEDNKGKDSKVDKQAIKKECEFICKDNPDNPN